MDAEEAVLLAPRRLPEAVLRLGVSSVGSNPQFKGLGSEIVIIGGHESDGITFVYDTKTARLDTAKPPADMFSMYRLSTPVGDKLHLLTLPGEPTLNLCEMPAAPELYDKPYLSRHKDDFIISTKLKGQLQRWSWKSGPSPPPPPAEGAVGVDNRPIQTYAVHQDGHTIFFSSSYYTFFLDTNTGNSARCIGEWSLPFHGRAYYDRDLDAWVGMQRDDSVEGMTWGRHYLCSCDVPLAVVDSEGAVPPPAWKLCEEELTFLEAPLRDSERKRTLVHTGRGRFCLVEAAPVREPEPRSKGASHYTCTNDGVEHLLLVTMFRAKHGKNGELVIVPCRSRRSYLVPNYFDDGSFFSDPPVAFWM
ncbi:hypothetical protein ACQ4PT_070000 [Festuca glaucescens]